MTIQDMHYSFKRKLNKLDSKQHRNLIVPEIDSILNEAQLMLVNMIAFPRVYSHLGFEINQRSIDDIKELVVPSKELIYTDNVFELPNDYMHYLKMHVIIKKENCPEKKVVPFVARHDDNTESSIFDRGSYIWRTVNVLFTSLGLEVLDGDFEVVKGSLRYLRRPREIHYAEGFSPNGYSTASGEQLVGKVDSELNWNLHNDIVDLAVLIASGEINLPDYQVKLAKLNYNKLI